MKEIEKFVARIMVDAHFDYSDNIGCFSDEPARGAVDLWSDVVQGKFFFRGEARYYNPPSMSYDLKDGPYESQDEEHQKYILQDLRRCIDYYDGDWHYTWIRAEAVVLLSNRGRCFSNRPDVYRITLKSDGLCGIESDSGDDYYREVWQDQVWELRWMLVELGFSIADMQEAVQREIDVCYSSTQTAPDCHWKLNAKELGFVFSDGPQPIVEPAGRLVLPKRSPKKTGVKPRKRR